MSDPQAATGGDARTQDFYDREAATYATHLETLEEPGRLVEFADLLAPGAQVLDFGCGSGWAAHRFHQMGFAVSGFDGSAGLAAEARARYGIDVTVGQFRDFSELDRYDGIWASFCLLHDSRAAMPGHLGRLHAALRTGGQLYLGLKEGEGAERDSLDRLYTYFSEPEMRDMLTAAGFELHTVKRNPGIGYDGAEVTELHLFAIKR